MEQECEFCHRIIDFPVECGPQDVGDTCACCGLILLEEQEPSTMLSNGD